MVANAASTLKFLNPATIKLEMYARIKDPRTWLFCPRYGRRLLPGGGSVEFHLLMDTVEARTL